MDGLCAGVAAMASVFFTMIAYLHGQTLVATLAASVLGSLAAPALAQGLVPPSESATPAPDAVPPGGPVQLSAPKAAALQDVQSALDAVRQAQRGGNFADYGTALQRLDDAMTKYNSTK